MSQQKLKSIGEVEAAIGEMVIQFQQEYMGRGPREIHTHLIGDFLVVRLKGVLTEAEKHLVKALPPEKGRDLMKQVRTHLVEAARTKMEVIVESVTGQSVVSLHQDISTITGEQVIVFTLANAPNLRDAKKGNL